MLALGRDAIRAHEAALRDYAHERLGAMNSVRIFGTAPGKGAIVAFEMEGAHATTWRRSSTARASRSAPAPIAPAAAGALRRDLHLPRLIRASTTRGRKSTTGGALHKAEALFS